MTLALVLLIFGFNAQAPIDTDVDSTDGTIVESEIVVPDELVVSDIERVDSGIRERLATIEIQRITYLSDGLRVAGYFLEPRDEGTYPAIVFNRGGNRDFGAITDRAVLSVLTRFASWGFVVVASQYLERVLQGRSVEPIFQAADCPGERLF